MGLDDISYVFTEKLNSAVRRSGETMESEQRMWNAIVLALGCRELERIKRLVWVPIELATRTMLRRRVEDIVNDSKSKPFWHRWRPYFPPEYVDSQIDWEETVEDALNVVRSRAFEITLKAFPALRYRVESKFHALFLFMPLSAWGESSVAGTKTLADRIR